MQLISTTILHAIAIIYISLFGSKSPISLVTLVSLKDLILEEKTDMSSYNLAKNKLLQYSNNTMTSVYDATVTTLYELSC